MLRGSYEEAAGWLEEARRLVPEGPEAAAIAGKLGELAFKRGDVRTAAAAIQQALVMIDRRVPRSRAAVAPLLAWEVLVQAAHSLLPHLFVGRRAPEEGGIDLLASRFYGRLGYAWWFERGKLATLWTHLRSLNLAERYPPTPEMAQAYSEHAPAMMLLPWHRRGVRFAQRSHEIRVRLGDRWGQGQSLHFWGAGSVRGVGLRPVPRTDARSSRAAGGHGGPMGSEQLPPPDRDGSVPTGRSSRRRGGQPRREEGRSGDRGCAGPGDRSRGVGQGDGRWGPGGADPDRARTIERGPPHARERQAGGGRPAPGRRRTRTGRSGRSTRASVCSGTPG